MNGLLLLDVLLVARAYGVQPLDTLCNHGSTPSIYVHIICWIDCITCVPKIVIPVCSTLLVHRYRCITNYISISASGSRGGLFGAGGRFKGGTDPIMEKFNESISFDKR